MPRLTAEELDVIRKILVREANRFIKHYCINTENTKFICEMNNEYSIKVYRSCFKAYGTSPYYEDFLFRFIGVIRGVAVFVDLNLSWKSGIIGEELVPQFRKKFKINKIMPKNSIDNRHLSWISPKDGDELCPFDFNWNF